MTFAERLKEERKKAGLSQKDFAEKLGLNARTYASYERGERDISTALLLNICTTLNISSDRLLGNESEFSIVEPPAMCKIPVIGEVAAGFQSLADMRIIDYMMCDASLLHSGYEYVYLKVKGDSMEPELHEGDLVLVRVQDVVESGDYAVVIIDDDNGLVKRVEYDDKHLTLFSENPYYPPRRFVREEMNRVRFFGKVISSIRLF